MPTTQISFKPIYATLEKISENPIVNGSFYISTDTGRSFFDINNTRVEINKNIEILADEDARLEILSPLNKFYFTLNEGNLYYYGSDWILINQQYDDEMENSISAKFDDIYDILSGELSSNILYQLDGYAVLSGQNTFLDDQTVSGDLLIQYDEELSSVSSLINNQKLSDLYLYSMISNIDDGQKIINQSETIIAPADNKIYKHILSSNDSISILTGSFVSGYAVTFEVHLIQPSSAVSFTFSNSIQWIDSLNFNSSNSAPDFSESEKLYAIVFRWDGEDLLANLAYTKDIDYLDYVNYHSLENNEGNFTSYKKVKIEDWMSSGKINVSGATSPSEISGSINGDYYLKNTTYMYNDQYIMGPLFENKNGFCIRPAISDNKVYWAITEGINLLNTYYHNNNDDKIWKGNGSNADPSVEPRIS